MHNHVVLGVEVKDENMSGVGLAGDGCDGGCPIH